MRLAPIPLFFYPDVDSVERYAADSSRTTHGAAECVDACRWLGRAICRALAGRPKREIALGDAESFQGKRRLTAIARGEYNNKSASEILGTGYVVESLEAAMWCFTRTETYDEAVLLATNLGDDADTTAAFCGQVAGACYGESGIPERWLRQLAMGPEIATLADRLCSADI